ncbi:phosphotransferase enzyme family-domain-containing protein [Mycena galopus ATCC 62051]|nr:phosphotransferase enzyme family-domain-containing protein [Mycena galopus ATCC 62051]
MEDPIFAVLYKFDDEPIEIDLEPLVYDVWSPSVRGDAQWSSIVERAGELLNKHPVTARARKPSDCTDIVMDIELAGGGSVFLRALACRWDDCEDPTEKWKCARLSCELTILRWLAVNAASIPVPRVLAFDEVTCLLVTTLMSGLDAMHSYHLLSPTAKQHMVASWGRVAVSMFRLCVPQQFGMIENPLIRGRPHVYVSPAHTFDTANTTNLHSFFTSAISSRRTRSLSRSTPQEHEKLCARLDRLAKGLKPLILLAQDTPFMARFTLTHRDLRPNNIMIDVNSGEVVGIVDWEFSGSMPACISADYPQWIRPRISESPLYRNPESTILSFFHEPRAERDRLCDLYEETVKKLDHDYYTCLLHGTRLRDALAWIEIDDNRDNDGFRMARWTEEHLFHTFAELSHRCA